MKSHDDDGDGSPKVACQVLPNQNRQDFIVWWGVWMVEVGFVISIAR